MVQTKLTIGQPGDKYEREADRVADAVMRMSGPQVQDVDTTRNGSDHGGTWPVHPAFSIQSQSEEASSARAEQDPSYVSPDLESWMRALPAPPNGGSPLDADTRAFMEQRLGHDFSQVRVHTGGAAGEAAYAINARAFTFGHHIAFGTGQYKPGTRDGRRLLAHELAHVAQQGAGITVRRQGPRPPHQETIVSPRIAKSPAQTVNDGRVQFLIGDPFSFMTVAILGMSDRKPVRRLSDESEKAFEKLYTLRNSARKGTLDVDLSQDLNLAAAEWFLLMQHVVGKDGDPLALAAPAAYTLLKVVGLEKLIRHDEERPATPPDADVLRWGTLGVLGGLIIHRYENPEKEGWGWGEAIERLLTFNRLPLIVRAYFGKRVSERDRERERERSGS